MPDAHNNVVNLVPLIGKERIEPPLVTNRKRGGCDHNGVQVVDELERSVTCQSCGAIRDPFDTLVVFAYEGDKQVEFQRKYDRLKAAYTKLVEEERRLKARVNRWRKKPGAFDARQLIAVVQDMKNRAKSGYGADVLATVLAKMRAVNQEPSMRGQQPRDSTPSWFAKLPTRPNAQWEWEERFKMATLWLNGSSLMVDIAPWYRGGFVGNASKGPESVGPDGCTQHYGTDPVEVVDASLRAYDAALKERSNG